MTDNPIKTRREGGILEVTLDRPKANAIDLVTSRIMGEAFRDFRDDPELRVAILRAAGDKFFCPGWDLKAAAAGDAVDGDYGVGGFGGIQELPHLNKPIIAAVNGICCGGGLELAISCDLILASETATFALPEIRSGTIADAASLKLPKRIPYHVAMDLLLTGRWFGRRGGASLGADPGNLQARRVAGEGLGVGPAARVGSSAGLRRHQGGGAGGRGHEIPGCAEPNEQAPFQDHRHTLFLRRPSSRAPAPSPKSATRCGRGGKVTGDGGQSCPPYQATRRRPVGWT